MFYKADGVSSGRSSFLSRDAKELVPISGDVIKILRQTSATALEQGR